MDLLPPSLLVYYFVSNAERHKPLKLTGWPFPSPPCCQAANFPEMDQLKKGQPGSNGGRGRACVSLVVVDAPRPVSRTIGKLGDLYTCKSNGKIAQTTAPVDSIWFQWNFLQPGNCISTGIHWSMLSSHWLKMCLGRWLSANESPVLSLSNIKGDSDATQKLWMMAMLTCNIYLISTEVCAIFPPWRQV